MMHDWEAISKTRASCFIGVFKHSKTIKPLGLQTRPFISFLVFENPDETLALVFEILHNICSTCQIRIYFAVDLDSCKFYVVFYCLNNKVSTITRALTGWNSVLYHKTEHGLMTLSWLSKFCFGIVTNLTKLNIPCATQAKAM